MSSELAEHTQDVTEPFIGFHFYADDAPRFRPESPVIPPSGSRVIRTADMMTEQRLVFQKIASRNPGPAPAIRKELWIALVAVVFLGGVAVLSVNIGRNAKQLALNGPIVPAPVAPVAPASQPLVMAAVGAPIPITPSPPQSSPGQTCRSPQTRAERLVCGNPDLAAEDRRLAQVYRAAIAGGAPKARLAREQDDWLKAREVAARGSGQEVQSLYATRIDDLMHWLDDDHAAALREQKPGLNSPA